MPNMDSGLNAAAAEAVRPRESNARSHAAAGTHEGVGHTLLLGQEAARSALSTRPACTAGVREMVGRWPASTLSAEPQRRSSNLSLLPSGACAYHLTVSGESNGGLNCTCCLRIAWLRGPLLPLVAMTVGQIWLTRLTSKIRNQHAAMRRARNFLCTRVESS